MFFMGYKPHEIEIIQEFVKGRVYEITSTGSVLVENPETGNFTVLFKREQVESIIAAYEVMQGMDIDLIAVLKQAGIKVKV